MKPRTLLAWALALAGFGAVAQFLGGDRGAASLHGIAALVIAALMGQDDRRP